MEYTISLKAHRKIIDKHKNDIDQNRRLFKELDKLKKIIENKEEQLTELNFENDKLKSKLYTLNEELSKLTAEINKLKSKSNQDSMTDHDPYIKENPNDFKVFNDKYFTVSTDNTTGDLGNTSYITCKATLNYDKPTDKSESKFTKLTKKNNEYIKSIFKKMKEAILIK